MSKSTRRQFLEDSMFAAAAAAMATGTSSQLFAADEPAKAKGPGDKLGVAVVGVKGRGNSHIGAFAGRKDNATDILYVVDVDTEIGEKRCDEIAKKQDGRRPKFVQDMRKALEDKSVDIVTIATPNHWHSLGAIWALQAGKHVYLEKPVSHNVSEGARVIEAARKYNKICAAGTQSRSNPGMIEAVKYVQDGKIGKLKVARGLCYKPRPSIGPKGMYEVPATVDYDLWCGPAPKLPVTRKQFHYDWHWQWEYGNGDLGNQGIHQVDICRWGMKADALCNSVVSYGGRYGYVDAGETANTQVILFDYDDASLVFEVRGLKTKGYQGASVGVIFEGTDGYVVIPTYNGGTAFDKDGKKITTFSAGGDQHHFANFLKAVHSGKYTDLNADVREGHLSSALCHLGNISYRLGEKIPQNDVADRLKSLKTPENVGETLGRFAEHLKETGVDLAAEKIQLGAQLKLDVKNETFIDNPKANTMLTRDYRKGFEVPAAGKV